jgi:recombination protein RecT
MADRTQSYANQEEERKTQVKLIVAEVDKQELKYSNMLPGNVPWSRFRNAFLTAVQSNPRLLDADRLSLFLALQKAANDGLLPDGREGAIVIYGDDQEDEEGNIIPSTAKGKKKAVWMPMVWGLCKAMRNTGNIKSIRCKVIYKGEKVIITDKDGEETYEHVRTITPEMSDDFENIIGAYSVVSYKDGGYDAEFMSRAQIDRRRKASKAKKGPWAPWYAEMAQKVPLRRLSNRVEKSAENERYFKALETDETLATTTIEGTVIDEGVQEIKGEFTAEKQAEKQPDKKAKPTSSASGGTASAATPSGSAPGRSQQEAGDAGSGSPGKGAGGDSPSSPPSIEIWATDEYGEPVEQTEPWTPMEFANWFASQLFLAHNPDALCEHNADAMGEAGQGGLKPLGVIQDAITRCKQRQEADRSAKAQAGNGVDQKPNVVEHVAKPKRVPIPVPKTPKGAEKWPEYTPIAKAEIEKLSTLEDIDDWVATNQPTYKNRVAEIAIDNRLRDRREAIVAAGGRIETDTGLLTRIRSEMAALNSEEEIKEWSMGPIRPIMMELAKRDPDAFDQAKAIIDERRFQVEVPT